MPSQDSQQRRKKRRQPRVKHVPVRTCVVCRESGAKRELTRIVRTPEGVVLLDPTGRMNGRGAYLCDKAACWDRATASNVLARALNIELTPETIASLTEFAAGHVLVDQQGEPGADSKDPR
jgi:predicted RNA-binding protein YlxR (DUF448 family)